MAEWLVTTKVTENLDSLDRLLAKCGAQRSANAPIPLDDDEQSVEVSGPTDLPARIRKSALDVRVYPNSKLTLYR